MRKLYKKAWAEIIKHERITILTHVNPDGDTVASATALKHLILDNSNVKQVKISGAPVPEYLSLVSDNEQVTDEFFNSSQVIVVDTSNKKRVFDQRVVTKETIKIDHHHNEEEWLISIGGDNWPAAGEVMYEFAIANDLKISKTVAQAIYIAIWTDTEGLTQRRLTDNTKDIIDGLDVDKASVLKSLELPKRILDVVELMKKKIIIKDSIAFLEWTEPVENSYIRLITGVLSTSNDFEVYVGLITNKNNSVRGSLRSKGNIDISGYAKILGGGGHHSSAGFSDPKMDDVLKVMEELKIKTALLKV